MPPLADHVPDAPNLGWFLGLGIGFALVVVVVAVVALLLTYASRMEDSTQEAFRDTGGVRDATHALPDDVTAIADSARGLLDTARSARGGLTGGSG